MRRRDSSGALIECQIACGDRIFVQPQDDLGSEEQRADGVALDDVPESAVDTV